MPTDWFSDIVGQQEGDRFVILRAGGRRGRWTGLEAG